MTLSQVAYRLSEFLTPECLWVEWSKNFCDYSRVLKGLTKVGRASIMPPISNVFRANLAWQWALSALNVSYRLSVLYRMIGRSTTLPGQAHRAEPDVRMVYELTISYFRGTLQPAQLTQITHYMAITCDEGCKITKYCSHEQKVSGNLNNNSHKNHANPETEDAEEQVGPEIAEDGEVDREGNVDSDGEEEALTSELWRIVTAQELGAQSEDEEDYDQ
jgi:hypothetical protein